MLALTQLNQSPTDQWAFPKVETLSSFQYPQSVQFCPRGGVVLQIMLKQKESALFDRCNPLFGSSITRRERGT